MKSLLKNSSRTSCLAGDGRTIFHFSFDIHQYSSIVIVSVSRPSGSKWINDSCQMENGSERLTQSQLALSHPFVIRPTATFWRDPINNLVGIHDVARLAMDAV
jgi:hypothetical protein